MAQFSIRTLLRSRQHRVILCFAVVGIRVAFSMPLELRANWIFRIASHASTEACVAASRRSLYTLALLPVWTAAGTLFFWLWSRQIASEHLMLLAALGIGIAELSLSGFHKIPFTCSYLPGKLRFNMAIVYLVLFLLSVTWGAQLEMRALCEPVLYATVLGTLIAAAAGACWRTTAQAGSAEAVLRFEEVPEPATYALNLHRDGVTRLPAVSSAIGQSAP